ncbi:MAG TPA: mercuric reductase [Thermoanaerobaculia bacterium]|nr:mercuric reductase [Thermoanaerobaculia bacterium]
MSEPGGGRPPILPWDEPNRELIANVHPPGWRNPEPADRYHLVVVGAGTAGLVTAAGAAGLGARVALVERHLMGGDCLNVGCVPSKGILRAARAWHEARSAARRFGGPEAAGDGDFAAAMARMRRIRAGISRHDSAERFRGLGVDVFLGPSGGAQFVASDAVEVGGAVLRFRKAVIATGGRPAVPPIEGLEEAGYLTNESVFELERLPPHLAVVGGGPIGCELAQAFARFGSRVTLLDMAPHVLPREDADAAEAVQRAMARDGVTLELGVRIQGVEVRGGEKAIRFERESEGDGEGGAGEVVCDEILLAVGRTPNVEGLGLEAAGVEYTRKGVTVDDRLRTSNRRVFAAGDVASKYQFTHVADALARIAIQNALFHGRAKASDLVIPWCTYTSPEVAHVGLTAEEARERGMDVETVTIPLADLDRAVLDDETEGFLRVHLRAGTDRILGATLVASHAGDMFGELCLAITAGVGLGKIASVIHPYPTQGEAVKKAADAWRRGKLTPFVKRVFGWRFEALTRFGV